MGENTAEKRHFLFGRERDSALGSGFGDFLGTPAYNEAVNIVPGALPIKDQISRETNRLRRVAGVSNVCPVKRFFVG